MQICLCISLFLLLSAITQNVFATEEKHAHQTESQPIKIEEHQHQLPLAEVLQKALLTVNKDNKCDEQQLDGNPAELVVHSDGQWIANDQIVAIRGEKFKFKEYAPAVFCQTRAASDVDSGKYFASLVDFPLKDWSNPGKSGSIFLVSQDGHFMLKSLNIEDKEPAIVKRILPAYTEHLIANRQSLLARYLGLYSIQIKERPLISVLGESPADMDSFIPWSKNSPWRVSCIVGNCFRCKTAAECWKQTAKLNHLIGATRP